MEQLLAAIDRLDRPVLQRAHDLYVDECGGHVDATCVRNLTERFGVDLATAVLYVHFETRLRSAEPYAPGGRNDERSLLLAIVPGAFYKEHPEVGGDGRDLIEISASQPWDCELIPCESLGTTAVNGTIINTFLESRLASHRVVLVSLSKGAVDVRVAQSLRPDLFESLAGCISVSGVHHGTMMSDWLLDKWYLRPIMRMMLWRHRVTRQPIEDLRYRPDGSFVGTAHVMSCPQWHVAAFPLQRHLSCRRARLWHRRFRRQGPNDSVVLLEDLLRLPGTVIPVWGSDHYLAGHWCAATVVTELISSLHGSSTPADSSRDCVSAAAES